ncbi:AI-2E family transporter [Epidermidibacterium keratini]|uniref:AI-2E family transporter n=1 Tax=Epidermidibacterium keratini TaxID=1891644 RepID=A0A7L4YN28_9ACTN|nr:AI-2E family transporter [Epidermidibacterium keratini]QHC00546.1 AI-2E family transporter [Epidermidibacterium keratini]
MTDDVPESRRPSPDAAAPRASSPGAASRASEPRTALPRSTLILLTLACMVLAGAGLRATSDIVGPLFLALCLTICGYPVRNWLHGRGCPKALANAAVVLAIYFVLVAIIASLVVGLARLVELLPTYSDRLDALLVQAQDLMTRLGVESDQLSALLQSIDFGSILSFAGDILGGTFNVAGLLVVVAILVLFLTLDTAAFTDRFARESQGRLELTVAFSQFAVGTRRYFLVSTVFGAIVAVLDYLALVILGVPAAFLWGVLAFVTNYIPNVGFVIGLVPPALLALIDDGPGTMALVIVIYVALNFIIQSLIQPKYVGDSVGLTTTASFLSLIVWSYLLGPLGAILAIPLSLLVKAVFVDNDEKGRWLQAFVGDQPDVRSRRERRGPREHRAHKRVRRSADAEAKD